VKNLAILGSTGSIGQSALAVVDAHPDRLRIAALAAGDNAALLAEQVARYCPEVVGMATADGADRLRRACGAGGVQIVSGGDASARGHRHLRVRGNGGPRGGAGRH
jgi:1-deoxy-D-xylulose-5-phosphate reductoisomerase